MAVAVLPGLALHLHDLLHLLEKIGGDNGRELALVCFALPFHEAHVKAIGQKLPHLGFGKGRAALREDAALGEPASAGFKAEPPFGKFLKEFTHDLRLLRMRRNVLSAVVEHESDNGLSRPLSALQLFLIGALQVARHGQDVLNGAPALNRHEKASVAGRVFASRRADGLDHSVLEKPAHAPLVNRIAIQAVNVPTENAVCFARLDTVEHPIEFNAPRLLGAPAFFKRVKDVEVIILGELG